MAGRAGGDATGETAGRVKNTSTKKEANGDCQHVVHWTQFSMNPRMNAWFVTIRNASMHGAHKNSRRGFYSTALVSSSSNVRNRCHVPTAADGPHT